MLSEPRRSAQAFHCISLAEFSGLLQHAIALSILGEGLELP